MNVWSAASSGGVGVTIDNWDISAIPPGAVFDVKYDTFSVPDKFVVENPVGSEVLNTGWRGSSIHNGKPLYPGGVTSPGGDTELGVFKKLTLDKFRMTVFGPDPNTLVGSMKSAAA